jgi:hypothetical protein
MAKKSKSAVAPVVDSTLEAQVQELAGKNKMLGGWLVASLMFVRREFVRNLNPKQFESPQGKALIEALKHIDSKVPSVTCTKCGGSGKYWSTYSNTWGVCFDCVMGRLIGKPGMQTVIDIKVASTYREQRQSRFEKPSNWLSHEEQTAPAPEKKPAAQPNSADIDL